MLKVSCPHCGKALRADSRLSGKKATCPACGRAISIADRASQSAERERDRHELTDDEIVKFLGDSQPDTRDRQPQSSDLERNAAGVAEPGDELRLAPLPETPPSLNLPKAVGTREGPVDRRTGTGELMLPNRAQGAAWGVAVLLASFIGACGLLGAATDTAAAGIAGFVLLVWLAAAFVALFLCIFGTGKRFTVCSYGDSASCTMNRVVAFRNLRTRTAMLTSKDGFVRTIREPKADASSVDLAMFCLIVFLCMAGAIPGLLFFFIWWKTRQFAEAGRHVTLELRCVDGRSFILYKEATMDYGAARAKMEQIEKFFRDFVPLKTTIERV